MGDRDGGGNQEGRNQQGELVMHIRDYNEREIFLARGSVHIDIDPSHGAPHGEHVDEEPPADHIETVDAGTEQVPMEERLELYRVAVNGDWNKALKIYNEHANAINSAISTRKETALHIATLAEQTYFAKELVKKMSKECLAHQDEDGNTALFFAAATGQKELVEAMLNKNEDLAMIKNAGGLLPIYIAAYWGHKDMVRYLYPETSKIFEDHDRTDLFVALINADMYDIALNMIKGRREHWAVKQGRFEETALHALARKPHMFSHAQQRRKCFNLVLGSIDSGDQMRQKAKELLELVWEQTISTGDRITDVVGKDWRPIFVAVEQGNIDFLRILIRSYPELVLKTNEKDQTIFHAAVMSRQEEIFELIHETRFKNFIAKKCDNNKNNMLHLAGELAPSDCLNLVPVPVFQLQLELRWFEKVKNVVEPRLAEQKNTCDTPETPRQLFIKKHKDLIKKGEEWMKNTTNYCMIVAILVATVVYAIAYAVPGGNKEAGDNKEAGGDEEDAGYPNFLHKSTFKIFALANALSFIFSISSVIIFLSLLTSTYALQDFLWSLPNKLVIGLASLFVSLLAMMVAFVIAFFIYFEMLELLLGYAFPVALATCMLGGLFIWSHRRLILQMFRSTYRSKKLFHPNPKVK